LDARPGPARLSKPIAQCGRLAPAFSLSKPEDVLIPPCGQPLDLYADCLIACLQVRNVPTQAESFKFRLVHVPEEDNYAHSEIRGFHQNDESRPLNPPKIIRKWFRHKLAEKAVIVRNGTTLRPYLTP
jgi:hypothetical protein